ncbi:MAG: YceI family protein [Fulvivirga sp.]|uniref:YceI family protein n=1 Tax=Fulvivirga sp. TaxID=1931237 RepID=UPI0032EC5C6C
MGKILTTTLFILFATCLNAQEVISSEISFSIKNAGIKVNGAFQLEDATIKFNPDDLDNCTIEGSIKVNTIDTGIGLRDKHLKKEDYFDAEKHPLITLKSKTIKRNDSDSFEGVFDLTIKGITKNITISFAVNKTDKNQTTYSAQFEIDRLDFGVGSDSWIMGDEVKVFVTLVTHTLSQN